MRDPDVHRARFGAPRSLYIAEAPAERFLSKEACLALGKRIAAMARGGGSTALMIQTAWEGNLRWGRNRVNTAGATERSRVTLARTILGASGEAGTSDLDDAALAAAVTQAEALRLWHAQRPDQYPVAYQEDPQEIHPVSSPKIWFEQTYTQSDTARAELLDPIVAETSRLGLLTAGFVQVSGVGAAVYRTAPDPLFRYAPMTKAQFSLTVRDAQGTRSGWAGVDFSDWSRIDPAALARTAIDKCERSKNAVAIEPGRFTAILEPQALCDLFDPVMSMLDRQNAEQGIGPFASARRGFSKIGEKVMDERITVSADPMDPDLGFIPFDWSGEPFLDTKWVDQGYLRALSYTRYYGVSQLQKDWALPNSTAYRISGGTTTLDEMIASTERGVLVTRLHGVTVVDYGSALMQGVTRDGLWLIERGKISKPIKNFRFTESPLFVLNNVEQLGVARRVFHPSAPVVVPLIKVRDFSFTGLMDAV